MRFTLRDISARRCSGRHCEDRTARLLAPDSSAPSDPSLSRGCCVGRTSVSGSKVMRIVPHCLSCRSRPSYLPVCEPPGLRRPTTPFRCWNTCMPCEQLTVLERGWRAVGDRRAGLRCPRRWRCAGSKAIANELHVFSFSAYARLSDAGCRYCPSSKDAAEMRGRSARSYRKHRVRLSSLGDVLLRDSPVLASRCRYRISSSSRTVLYRNRRSDIACHLCSA